MEGGATLLGGHNFLGKSKELEAINARRGSGMR
jgi:hypothetical protein